jgi:hypothetical protein
LRHLAIAFRDPRLGGFVARLQREYGDCLPPPKALSP